MTRSGHKFHQTGHSTIFFQGRENRETFRRQIFARSDQEQNGDDTQGGVTRFFAQITLEIRELDLG